MDDEHRPTYYPHRLRIDLNPKRPNPPPMCVWCGGFIFVSETIVRARDRALSESHLFHTDCYRAWRSPEAHMGRKACLDPSCGCWKPGKMPRGRATRDGKLESSEPTTELYPGQEPLVASRVTDSVVAIGQLMYVTLPRLWAAARMGPETDPAVMLAVISPGLTAEWAKDPTSFENLQLLARAIDWAAMKAKRG